jgi:asparagine synthase (glutamine-hydrolysing)
VERPEERFQRFDLYTFNQSHTQAYDRLGAPFGVAVVTPFLAPEVVGIAERLPSGLKTDGVESKPVLKTLAARYFPREWIYRPHQGFPTPTLRWLQGPLERWRREMFDRRTETRGDGVLSTLRGRPVDVDFEAVWTAMTLESFSRQFIDGDGGPAGIPS